MSTPPNAAQAEIWNDAAGPTWVRFQAELDRQLEPIGRRALAALDARSGERILDVGCGAGSTTLEIAVRVGPDGHAVGTDISRPLLEAARARPRPRGAASPQWIEADAQTHPFEPTHDAVFSRFGVMFFDDPGAAFANLRRAAPVGRLAFVCWRAVDENPWMTLAMRAAADLVPAPTPTAPGAPGPFAFADPDRVRSVLSDAGWSGIDLTPFDTAIGAGDVAHSARVMTRVGPLGAALREVAAEDGLIQAAEARVRDTLAPYVGADGQVSIASATWVVTARA